MVRCLPRGHEAAEWLHFQVDPERQKKATEQLNKLGFVLVGEFHSNDVPSHTWEPVVAFSKSLFPFDACELPASGPFRDQSPSNEECHE